MIEQRQSGAMIEARGLSKFYGPFVAIREVSFSIPKGQIVAFLGPNGAGKTTTMKILAGFVAPSEGSASISGYDVAHDRLAASRSLGYLPENGPLYLDMTPDELLSFFAEARSLPESNRRNRISNVLAQTALQDVKDKPIGKLSRGYRQRVGLAQALLHDPAVLIMDEPTAGLDPNQIHDFRAHIAELGKEKTILLSTHILQEVEALAQRVLLIHAGQLLFDGTPQELASGKSLEQRFRELTRELSTGKGDPEATGQGAGA